MKKSEHRKRVGLRLLGALLLAGATVGCSVEKTQEGRAPDVDVDVDPGRWPKYNVNWADVDVGTRTKTVTVPKLQWVQEEETVEVPYIDINPPNAGERVERTIAVDVEVPNGGWDVEIQEVRATGDDLWVIAQMRQAGTATGGARRVSDQVVVNAPEDLDVRKVIVGERPEGSWNEQYSFYNDRAALDARLPQNSRVIYSRQG